MSQNQIIPVVSIVNKKLTTTSLNVSEVFKKNHKDVLRSISGLEIPDDFRRRNFAPSSYTNGQKKKHPMYLMTRDGFTILVMGFTGKKAMQFKLAYIEAFNKMEAKLRAMQQPSEKPEPKALPSPTGLNPEQAAEIRFMVRQKTAERI